MSPDLVALVRVHSRTLTDPWTFNANFSNFSVFMRHDAR
jgi:hypothetical protein